MSHFGFIKYFFLYFILGLLAKGWFYFLLVALGCMCV